MSDLLRKRLASPVSNTWFTLSHRKRRLNMFYSNDILSRRKTGLGIVWLAATLGDRNIVRRLSRKEILSVNIAKTCQSVLRPTEPLALRLSSQLMFGVVKLYGHQTELLYQDVSSVHGDVRRQMLTTWTVSSATKTIDMRKGSKNVDAITLPLDLAFFTLDFDHVTSGLLYRWSVEPLERGELGVGMEAGFRTPTPVRFVEEEARITLAGRGFEEEEVGLARGYGEGEDLGPVFGEGYDEDELEGLDLGLEGMEATRLEPITPGALEGIQRHQLGDDTSASGPLVEWPELEDRLAEEAAQMEAGPIIQGVATVTPARRLRDEEQVEALLGPPARRARPTPLPFEDAETMLNDTQLRTARSDYAQRMALERAARQARKESRQADALVRRMMWDPPEDLSLDPMLSDLWQMSVGAHMLSRRARFRQLRDEAGMLPMGEAPPTPPPPTPMQDEEAEVGVARAAATELSIPAALGGARDSLPWNVFMEHRRRSSMMPSISYDRPTFERDTTPLRPRQVSVETPTGLRRAPPESPLFPPATPSTVAPMDDFYQPPLPETPSVEGFRLGLPTAPTAPTEPTEPIAAAELLRSPTPPAHVFQEEMEEETRNFYEYALSIREQIEDPAFLFFSDLAPVASSTPAVAAQAFYHTLALASRGNLTVKQHEPYQQIRISLLTP